MPTARLLLDAIADPARARPAGHEPTTPEGWLTLSLTQFQAQRFDDCIASSRHALQLRPDYAEAFNNICAAQNALEHYADAADACEQALRIKPDYPLARNNLAVAKAKLVK